jgi:repressor LexA
MVKQCCLSCGMRTDPGETKCKWCGAQIPFRRRITGETMVRGGGLDSRQIFPVWERITEALGISSVNLISIRLDVARQSVYDWQKGKIPAMESLIRIAEVSRASIHWLVTGEGPRRVSEPAKSPAGPVTIYIGEAEHALITKLATAAGISKEEQIRDLILENLSQRGLIRTTVDRTDVHSDGREYMNQVQARLWGKIAAGKPIDMDEENKTVYVARDLVQDGHQTFVLEVQGDSMIEEDIRDGDYIICHKATIAESGQTVVALINGCAATLKKYFPEYGKVRLQPANRLYEPIILHADQVQIQGIVTGIQRRR